MLCSGWEQEAAVPRARLLAPASTQSMAHTQAQHSPSVGSAVFPREPRLLGTGADLLCSLTNHLCPMAMPWSQQAAPMAAPCKTLPGKLPTAQAFHAPGRFSHASILELAQAQVFYDLGRQREQPSEAAGADSLESNSCSGKCPLPHSCLQKGLVTSGTWSCSTPVYQLPQLPSACVSAATISRDPEKDLLNALASTPVLLLQGSPVLMSCLSLWYSRSGFVPDRGVQHDKMTACSPIDIQL